MTKSNTVRRDTLLKLALAGKLLCKCDYSLSDDYQYDFVDGMREKRSEFRTVEIRTKDSEQSNDKALMFPHWFEGAGGKAVKNEDGTINLRVHSNLSFTLKIKE